MGELKGRSLIGFERGRETEQSFQGINPATGEKLMPGYYSAGLDEVDRAAQLASEAFTIYGRKSGREKADFLRRIARNIEALGDVLFARASEETALPNARIQMETGRTCNQLRMFADLIEEGSWVDARIDRENPAREPAPKPDVRSMLRPLGPVVVFCASNFPIAFSVAGGDTASALAAGNPVIVKAHPAHPGAAEMVGCAIRDAVRESGLPEGVFSMLYDSGIEVGTELVRHHLVKAGGFTGSRAGGRALMDVAASRPEPVPFYAEMGSTNPVFILPGAMRERGEQIATGLHASVTLGAGQFCTNPGLVLIEDDEHSKSFAGRLAELMAGSPEFTMLTPGISSSYRDELSSRAHRERVKTLVQHSVSSDRGGCHAGAALFKTDVENYLANPDLGEEVFGPSTLVVTHSDREKLMEAARALEGHLTATVHGTEEDLREFADLLAVLETKVGRIVFNGFPTGVEVCDAMFHGGPYPATSDGRSTSVGTRAIFRFARPVCYQDFPDAALPDELRNDNPLGIWRMVDGDMTREAAAPLNL